MRGGLSAVNQLFVQNRDLCLPHMHLMPRQGGPRWNIAMTLGIKKLECFKYTTVKKFGRYAYSF